MGGASRRTTKWVFGSVRARPGVIIGGRGGGIGAAACISAKPGAGARERGGVALGCAAGGAATRTGASAELPASLRGGGLGFAEGGRSVAAVDGLGAG